jgi:hypothetical protein
VTVGVDCRGDRLVTKPGLDVGQRRTADNQPRDMGLPQIVEPERRATVQVDVPTHNALISPNRKPIPAVAASTSPCP